MSMRQKTRSPQQAPEEGDPLTRRDALARILKVTGAATAAASGAGLLEIGAGANHLFAQEVKSEEEALRCLYPKYYRKQAALAYRTDGLKGLMFRVPLGGALVVHNQGDIEDRVIVEDGLGQGKLSNKHRFEVDGKTRLAGPHKAPPAPKGVDDQIVPLGTEYRSHPAHRAGWRQVYVKDPSKVKITVLDKKGAEVANPTPDHMQLMRTRDRMFNGINNIGVPWFNRRFMANHLSIEVDADQQAFMIKGFELHNETKHEPPVRLIVTDDGKAILQWDKTKTGRWADLPLERPDDYPKIGALFLSSMLHESRVDREKFINPPIQKPR